MNGRHGRGRINKGIVKDNVINFTKGKEKNHGGESKEKFEKVQKQEQKQEETTTTTTTIITIKTTTTTKQLLHEANKR